jgi:hypothetical protein
MYSPTLWKKTSVWCSSLSTLSSDDLMEISCPSVVAGANPVMDSFGSWLEMTWAERCDPTCLVAPANVFKASIDGINS